jgi:hypothetical protein
MRQPPHSAPGPPAHRTAGCVSTTPGLRRSRADGRGVPLTARSVGRVPTQRGPAPARPKLTTALGGEHLGQAPQRGDNQVVFQGQCGEFCHGVLHQRWQQQRVYFCRIVLAHRAQILVARFGRPRGIAHHLYEPVPFLARATTHADFAILAGEDHLGVSTAGAGGTAAVTLPRQVVMDIQPAVPCHVARQHICQRNIDPPFGAARLAGQQRHQATGRQHRAALMFGNPRRQR